MVGLAMAGRHCQPTNPPPKHYKPPIMTKAQQYGNLQQYNTNPKIAGPCCRAGTSSYVAIYSHNLTNTRKPTMTPPTDKPCPMLPKSDVQHATDTVSKKFIIGNANSMTASPTPQSAKQLLVNRYQETPQTPQQTTSLSSKPAKAKLSPNIDIKLIIRGKPTMLTRSPLPCHPSCNDGTNPLNNLHNPSPSTPANPRPIPRIEIIHPLCQTTYPLIHSPTKSTN